MATKKRSKKLTNPTSKKVTKHRIPRQDVLPGVGDEKIAAIENAAYDYAEGRDERQELTKKEVELKTRLLDLMHSKGLTEYKRNGISVKVLVEKEKVQVRVKEEGELDVEVSKDAEAASA